MKRRGGSWLDKLKRETVLWKARLGMIEKMEWEGQLRLKWLEQEWGLSKADFAN